MMVPSEGQFVSSGRSLIADLVAQSLPLFGGQRGYEGGENGVFGAGRP